MKKRRVRKEFVITTMITGVSFFEYGLMAHGSLLGTHFELLGMAVIALAIFLGCAEFEVKNEKEK